MSHDTTMHLTADQFVTEMTERMRRIARALSAWSQTEAHTLQEMEEHIVRVMHELGAALLQETITNRGLAHSDAEKLSHEVVVNL